MTDQADILGTLKSGLGVAGKLAGRGFTEVSGLMKKEDVEKGQSGVYWSRGPWANDNGLVPLIDFNETQEIGRYKVSIVKRVTTSKAERAFIAACGCCLDCDRLAEAQNSLLEAVESDPQYTDGYFFLGCLALERQLYSEAVTYYQKALLCQQGLGSRFKKHLPSFRMSVRLTPSSTLALYPDLVGLNALLALALRQAGQSASAITSLQQLQEVIPRDPILLFVMAILRLECSQYAELVEGLSEVLPSSTLHVASLLLVGCACSKMGEVMTAREVYRKALESSEYDSLMRLDLQCALAESLGSAGTGDVERIKQEYPTYVPFLQRLGVSVGAYAVPPQAQIHAASAVSPMGGSAPVPGVPVPGMSVPGTSVPGVPGVSVAPVPGVPVPGVPVPGMSVPGTSVPGVPGGSVAPVPGVPVPGVPVPGVPVPGVPGVSVAPVPGVPVPGMSVPGVSVPGAVPGAPGSSPAVPSTGAQSGLPTAGLSQPAAYDVPLPYCPEAPSAAAGAPVAGAPVAGAPVAGAPVAGVPVAGAPVAGVAVSAAPAVPLVAAAGSAPMASAPSMSRPPAAPASAAPYAPAAPSAPAAPTSLMTGPPVHVVEPLPPRVDGTNKLVCAERNLEYVLGDQPFFVGREEGDAVLFFDGSVSRSHARIICVNGRYQVEDLHSTNGTWLNGYRLNGGCRYEINRGDVVQFGLTKFRLL